LGKDREANFPGKPSCFLGGKNRKNSPIYYYVKGGWKGLSPFFLFILNTPRNISLSRKNSFPPGKDYSFS
jgi:hypothetical protein